MLPKLAIAGLAATAVIAATALMPTAASAGGRGGGYSEMNCGYVRVNANRQRQPGNGQWVYQCR